MSASFDFRGYLSDTPIPGRTTPIDPPPPNEWPAGARPNFTGYAWIYQPWPAPPMAEDEAGGRIVTRLAFLDRFQDAELVAILAAAAQSTPIQVWVKKLELAGEVDLDSPRTVAGVRSLEAIGLLASGRAAEILA
jgi:hypothetical protein